ARAAPAWEALAQGYVRMYRILDALTVLDVWLKSQPDSAQALFLRGEVYRQANAIQKAVPDYRRAVELEPTRKEARWWLSVGLVDNSHFAEALEQLEVLRSNQPNDPKILTQIGACRNGLGQMQEARQVLDGVLAEHPDFPAALRARARTEM